MSTKFTWYVTTICEVMPASVNWINPGWTQKPLLFWREMQPPLIFTDGVWTALGIPVPIKSHIFHEKRVCFKPYQIPDWVSIIWFLHSVPTHGCVLRIRGNPLKPNASPSFSRMNIAYPIVRQNQMIQWKKSCSTKRMVETLKIMGCSPPVNNCLFSHPHDAVDGGNLAPVNRWFIPV